jgi:hypothetical protein
MSVSAGMRPVTRSQDVRFLVVDIFRGKFSKLNVHGRNKRA